MSRSDGLHVGPTVVGLEHDCWVGRLVESQLGATFLVCCLFCDHGLRQMLILVVSGFRQVHGSEWARDHGRLGRHLIILLEAHSVCVDGCRSVVLTALLVDLDIVMNFIDGLLVKKRFVHRLLSLAQMTRIVIAIEVGSGVQ